MMGLGGRVIVFKDGRIIVFKEGDKIKIED